MAIILESIRKRTDLRPFLPFKSRICKTIWELCGLVHVSGVKYGLCIIRLKFSPDVMQKAKIEHWESDFVLVGELYRCYGRLRVFYGENML